MKLTKTKYADYSGRIAAAEMQQAGIEDKDTLNSSECRVHENLSDESRVELREKIYKDLINKKRLDNDNNIKLNKGGSLPQTPLKNDKQAFYIIGLPASGKSIVANNLSDKYGAIILDADYAKRKFPEYNHDYGASVVHEESSVVIYGGKGKYKDEPSVLSYAVENNYNIIIPKIGDNKQKILNLTQALNDQGYSIHLILVRLDREKATIRALLRFIKTKRYVPLSMIFDTFSNEPTITFFDLKNNVNGCANKLFKSFTMISTDVPYGNPYQILLKDEDSPQII